MPDLGRLKRHLLPYSLPITAPLYPSPPWPLPGTPWHPRQPLNMISATYSVSDTELPLARFVMPY